MSYPTPFEDANPRLGALLKWWVGTAPHFIWIFCEGDKCWSRRYRITPEGKMQFY